VGGSGRQAADARDHRVRGVGSRHGAGAGADAEAARRGCEPSLPPDFDSRFQKGDFVGSIYGHGGSIREPYDTMRLYQSQSIAVPGAHAANFTHWKNPQFDKLVDEVYVTDPLNVPKLKELFRAAMEIWLPELPDIQLLQNYHRIPMNTDRWKNCRPRTTLTSTARPGT